MPAERLRAYVIGFEPPGLDLDQMHASGELERMMASCDFCVQAPLAVGQTCTVYDVVFEGSSDHPGLGVVLRCVGHERNGKILVLEPEKPS